MVFFKIIICLLLSYNLSQAHDVAITQIVAHPSLDAVRKGIIDELKQFDPNINLSISNANGNITTATQIAVNLAAKDIDVAIGISTPSAQSLHQKIKDKPVIFSTVTDPKKAGLIGDTSEPNDNVTGVTNNMAVEKYFNFIEYLLPKANKIGVIYNSSEINSITIIEEMKKNNKFSIVEKAITNSADTSLALKSLLGKIDCLLMIQDNMVATSGNVLLKTANKNNLPVIAAFPEAIELGALAAIAYDEYKIGRQTGKMVIRLLNGAKVKDNPVENAKVEEKIINLNIARKLKISLPKDYKKYFTIIK